MSNKSDMQTGSQSFVDRSATSIDSAALTERPTTTTIDYDGYKLILGPYQTEREAAEFWNRLSAS